MLSFFSSRRSATVAATAPASRLAAGQGRWLALLLQVHWISSAICLLGMLLFSVTGITLNHASSIEARPRVQRAQAELPAFLLIELQQAARKRLAAAPAISRSAAAAPSFLPPALAPWVHEQLALNLSEGSAAAEWSADELYLALPRPGGDAWLRIDLESGEAEAEVTDRGWISWLNDLHKGRHTGVAWSWFIDAFAAGCLLFSLTGLLILKVHAGRRHATWPLLGLGVVLPLLLILLFLH